eukprot:5422390-Karenia_brevis.AAC.1
MKGKCCTAEGVPDPVGEGKKASRDGLKSRRAVVNGVNIQVAFQEIARHAMNKHSFTCTAWTTSETPYACLFTYAGQLHYDIPNIHGKLVQSTSKREG